MNGYVYLREAVRRRLQEFAVLAAEARDAKLTDRLPTGAMLSEEAMGTIVLNIGHGLADAHGKSFEVLPFMTFEPEADGVAIHASETVRQALRTLSLYEDPQLLKIRPEASKEYWMKRLDVDKVETSTITSILQEFVEARLRGGWLKPSSGETSELAEACVRAFFTSLANGVVARKSVRIDGLGVLSPGSKPEEISFVPDDRIVMAVRFDTLRHVALPYFKRTRAAELGPLEGEPAITDEMVLEHAEKSLPASVWSRSRDFFRLALRRKAS